MKTLEAAQIIESIVKAITENPNQFHFDVKATATGQKISTSGGTGLSITVSGGASGSNTIGQIIRVGDAEIQIAQKAAGQAIDQQMQALIDTLSSMSAEMRKDPPDKNKLAKMYESIKGTWVPTVITNVVSDLISSSFGS